MEEVILRFSHLGEDIFDSLDNRSLLTSKKVSRTWNSFIKDRKFLWIRILKQFGENSYVSYVEGQVNWSKLFLKTRIEDVRQFAIGKSNF